MVSVLGLGDDRRSFSYYKAISVIEKLPFKIDSVDQVKDLPSIGKSLQAHVSSFSLQFKLLVHTMNCFYVLQCMVCFKNNWFHIRLPTLHNHRAYSLPIISIKVHKF